MKLIELRIDTSAYLNSDFSGTLLVNPEQICTIIENQNVTKVFLSNGECLTVNESCKEIQDKIRVAYGCPKKDNGCKWLDKQGSCWYFMPDSKLPCSGSDKCEYYEKGVGVPS